MCKTPPGTSARIQEGLCNSCATTPGGRLFLAICILRRKSGVQRQSVNQTRESQQSRILLAEDDGHIREVVAFALRQAGYDVEEAEDGRIAWNKFSANEESFALIVLDILMPGLDGLDVCRRIRERSKIPLIFLSSRDEELDRILGLEMGADDYVTKPFSPRELVARIRAALRRFEDVRALLEGTARSEAKTDTQQQEADEEVRLSHGPLTLDPLRHECTIDGKNVILTVSEFGLLAALLRTPDHVLTRLQLVERAYGDTHFLSDRTVDSHVRRIRKKLKQAGFECIETVYGVGYRLSELTK